MMSGGQEATGVIVTWFVESGDEVTPATLVAEVAVDKVDAEVYPEDSGVITLLAQENTAIRQGSVIAHVS
jgi:pyruvate/2-oxoglutarate dehydrogenase complex dihydrolipoamide acyltransferase (E2) component